MKLKTLYFVLSLTIGATLSGCIEEYEADIPAAESEVLVVEGTICSGQMNTFFLTRTQPVNSYDWDLAVEGATVSVRGSDGSEYTTMGSAGCYTCWIDRLDPDVEYSLVIKTDGETYVSEPQKPLRTEKIAEVCGVQNTKYSNIDVLVTPAAPFEPDKTNYYSWTYDETWEVHPLYTTTIRFDTQLMKCIYDMNQFAQRGWKDAANSTIMVGSSTNYEGQHIHSLKIYDIDCEDERIYYRYSGLLHQRAITKAEYEYELARRQAGSEMGGLFTPLPSQLPTNIRCLTSNKRAIGFVGCSLNTSDYRFFLNASDYYIDIPKHADMRYWLYGCTENDCKKMVELGMYLCAWDDRRKMGGSLFTAWATESLLDVRLEGAYIEEPYFWKLTENVSY